jgi:DNA-binding LytR/AlgR family response regulator
MLDIRMPELNGFALYQEIRRLDKKVKIYFLTAGEAYDGVYSELEPHLVNGIPLSRPGHCLDYRSSRS